MLHMIRTITIIGCLLLPLASFAAGDALGVGGGFLVGYFGAVLGLSVCHCDG